MPERGTVYLSIVVPAYNEEKRLGHTLRDILDYLTTLPESSEVIVVDDGSQDGTRALVAAMCGAHPSLTVHSLPENRGKGEAVRQGMLRAHGRYRLFLDADGSIALTELEGFLPHLRGGAPIVIGHRVPMKTGDGHDRSAVRKLLGMGFRLLCRSLILWEVRDFTCGFKCFSEEAAVAIFSRQKITGWAFDAEILHLARVLGYPLVQVAVRWKHDAHSRVRVGRDMVSALWELLAIVRDVNAGR